MNRPPRRRGPAGAPPPDGPRGRDDGRGDGPPGRGDDPPRRRADGPPRGRSDGPPRGRGDGRGDGPPRDDGPPRRGRGDGPAPGRGEGTPSRRRDGPPRERTDGTPREGGDGPPRRSPSARGIATEVLHRVATEGSWATPTLDAALSRARLDARDSALATSLVYGALRVLPALDAALDAHLPRPDRLDAWARAAMRVAAYQILHQPRIPVSAAVNECVALVRRERGKLSGVANAVLRKVARPPAASPPMRVVAPSWIAEALVASLGQELAAQLLTLPLEDVVADQAEPVEARLDAEQANAASASSTAERVADPPHAEPTTGADTMAHADTDPTKARALSAGGERRSARGMPVDLRALGSRDALAARLREARPQAEIAPGITPECLHVWRAGDPRTLPGFDEGAFTVQEQGSQLVGELVGARPGELVLDACAGHGGKTAQLALAVGATGHVIAADLHEPRLERGEESFARLKLDAPIEAFAIDWTVGDGGLGEHPAAQARGGFDRVLVDAPCSGLGTLRRRPEILLRVDAPRIAELAATQLAILRRVAPLVRPGGVVVYAVCSPLAAESVEVAAAFEADAPSFVRHPFELDRVIDASFLDPSGIASPNETLERAATSGTVTLGPWLDGCDAYRVIAWTRRA